MRRIVLVALLLVVGFSVGISQAADHPNVASLDAETFVVASGSSIYLLKADGGRINIKDAVRLYSEQEGVSRADTIDKVIFERQTIEKR